MTDRGFAPPTGSLAMNIGLIGGIAAGVIVLLFVLVYAVYKYRAKEEEIRKLDRLPTHQSADFEFPVAGGGGASGARCHFSPSDSCDVTTNMIPVSTETANNGNGNAKRSKKRDVKEWYVWGMVSLRNGTFKDWEQNEFKEWNDGKVKWGIEMARMLTG